MASKEELEETLELLQAVASKKTEINTLDREQKENLAAMARLLNSRRSDLQGIQQAKLREIKLQEELNTVGSRARAQELKEHADTAAFVLKKLQHRGRAYKQAAAEVNKINDKTVATQKAAFKELNDGIVRGAASSASGVSSAFAAEIGGPLIAGMRVGIDKMKAMFAGTTDGVAPALNAAFKGSPDTFQGAPTTIMDELLKIPAKLGKMAADMAEEQFNDAVAGIRNVIVGLDDDFADYRHTVGIDLPGAFQAFVSAMDDSTDMAREWNKAMREEDLDFKMIEDVYITTREASSALQTLTQETNIFTSVLKGQLGYTKQMGGFLVNQVAAMAKLGVAESKSAKVFQIATKAMHKQGLEMVTLQRQVANVGLALDKDLNETMDDFTKMAPQLVMFGKDMTKVFANLEVQSKATGLAADGLLKTAMKFDTFEGAAEAAGRLNAILGETAIDTMALIHASPDEKINMMRDAINGSLGPFHELDRRTQAVIANIIGMGDNIQEAQQLFGNTDAYEEFGKAMEEATDPATGEPLAMTGEQISDLAKSAASADEKIAGAAANAANTLTLGTQLMQLTSRFIYEGADTVAGMAAGIQQPIDAIRDMLPAALTGGSVGDVPDIDKRGMKKTWKAKQAAAERRRAQGSHEVLDAMIAKQREVQKTTDSAAAASVAANERVQGSHNVTSKVLAKGPGPGATAAINPKTFKDMATAAKAFGAALAPLPATVNALAKSLQAISGTEVFKLLPAMFAELQGPVSALNSAPITIDALSTSMRALSGDKALAPLVANVDALSQGVNTLTAVDLAAVAEDLRARGMSIEDVAGLDLEGTFGATKTAGPTDTMDSRTREVVAKAVAGHLASDMSTRYQPWKTQAEQAGADAVSATPMARVADYQEAREATESKTLDTTTYIEKTIELVGKQDVVIESHKELARKIDKLITALGKKGDRDMKDRLDVKIRVGDREFNAQVIEALRSSTGG
tara:strand:+ start:84 stop:3002 length:2919 start_codon:yes stop_codon:yes gene_type:complete